MISQSSQYLPSGDQQCVYQCSLPFQVMQLQCTRVRLFLCMQVDREVMMTTGEAAATNDKLPKGFMYVPANTLANSRQQPH